MMTVFLRQAVWLYEQLLQHPANSSNGGRLVCSGAGPWRPFTSAPSPLSENGAPRDSVSEGGLPWGHENGGHGASQ